MILNSNTINSARKIKKKKINLKEEINKLKEENSLLESNYNKLKEDLRISEVNFTERLTKLMQERLKMVKDLDELKYRVESKKRVSWN